MSFKLKSGLFTTAAVDNIDYNPTLATAKESFHGTGISLIQHPSHIPEGSVIGISQLFVSLYHPLVQLFIYHHSTQMWHQHPETTKVLLSMLLG